MGIYTDKFNITIQNCNILDGNWSSSNAERHGIYFNSSNNSLIFNNSVNVSNSRAIFLHSSSNFNNLTSNRLNSVSGYAIRLQSSFNNSLYNINAYSQTNYAIYIHSSSNNTLSNNNFTGNTGILIAYGSSNNNISKSNVTGIDETGGYPIWIYQCNYNHFSDINAYAIDGYGAGVSLDSSNYSTFFNINTTCTTTSGVYDMGIYLYNSHFNNFTNIFSNSTSSAVALEYSSYNNFSNLEANSNYDDLVDYSGMYFWESSYNRIINSNITSKTNYGFSLTDNSKFNILNEVNIISNLNISLKFKESASSNIVANSTFISSNGQENLLDLDSTCNFNTFYGNNFTETSGYYVQDLNGSNYYNTTLAGQGEGNTWNDVMNGSVNITGNVSSTLNPSLYLGEYGTGYPYNNTNSFGKISGNVVDYAPLTNQFEGELPIYPNISFVSPTTSAGNHVQTFITANVSVENASSVVNLTIFLYNSSSGNLIVQNSTNSNKLFWNITGLSVGNYSLNASVLDSDDLVNSTSTLSINLIAASAPEEEPEDPPSSGGGSSTQTQNQYNYQLNREFYEQGEEFQMRRNNQISFRHQQENHTITLERFDSRTARVTIRSDPITVTLERDVAQEFDLDNDSVEDIEVTYAGIDGLNAQIIVKRIVEVAGESEVYTNTQGGEVQEIENTGVGDYTPQGPSQETINQEISKTNKRTMSSALKTILWGFVIIVLTLVILALIGKNSIRNKKRYSEFLDN